MSCYNILGIPTLTCWKGVKKLFALLESTSRPANNETLLLDTTFVLYVYVYHYFRYMPSNTNLSMPSSLISILVVCFLTCSAGVLSQFSPPSGDICPGSDIEFSCVGNSFLVSNTRWEVTPDGGDAVCTVAHNVPGEMDNCGPGDMFTSSLTGRDGINYTSSLRAEDVPLSLNGTVVECVDAALQIIGSANICIIGKSKCLLHAILSPLVEITMNDRYVVFQICSAHWKNWLSFTVYYITD